MFLEVCVAISWLIPVFYFKVGQRSPTGEGCCKLFSSWLVPKWAVHLGPKVVGAANETVPVLNAVFGSRDIQRYPSSLNKMTAVARKFSSVFGTYSFLSASNNRVDHSCCLFIPAIGLYLVSRTIWFAVFLFCAVFCRSAWNFSSSVVRSNASCMHASPPWERYCRQLCLTVPYCILGYVSKAQISVSLAHWINWSLETEIGAFDDHRYFVSSMWK